MIRSLNKEECISLLANNYIGHLAYVYRGRPFIGPITYFFNKGNTIIGYSNEGHKIMSMRKNNKVSLEVAEIANINNWESVLAHGIFEELSGSDAKGYLREFATGIKGIILRKEEKNLHFIGDFSSKIYDDNLPIVFKIIINEMTGKSRIR